MRILVLVGSDKAAQTEARFNSGRSVVFRSRPFVAARIGDAEVHYMPVRSEQDTEKFRGLRYDLIIEDGSFNVERSHEKGRWLDLVRMMVLR